MHSVIMIMSSISDYLLLRLSTSLMVCIMIVMIFFTSILWIFKENTGAWRWDQWQWTCRSLCVIFCNSKFFWFFPLFLFLFLKFKTWGLLFVLHWINLGEWFFFAYMQNIFEKPSFLPSMQINKCEAINLAGFSCFTP